MEDFSRNGTGSDRSETGDSNIKENYSLKNEPHENVVHFSLSGSISDAGDQISENSKPEINVDHSFCKSVTSPDLIKNSESREDVIVRRYTVGDMSGCAPSKKKCLVQVVPSFGAADNKKHARRVSGNALFCNKIAPHHEDKTVEIDMSTVHSKLNHLHRLDEEDLPMYKPGHGFLDHGYINASRIILTDIALNQTPDPVLSSSNVSRQHTLQSSTLSIFNRSIDTEPILGEEAGETDSIKSSVWNKFFNNFKNDVKSKKLRKKSIFLPPDEDNLINKLSEEEETCGLRMDDISNLIEHSKETDTAEKEKSESRDGLRLNWTLLDFQRDRERQDLQPSGYIDDIKVLHSIHRREMISKLLYREQGQLFYRKGSPKDPYPPYPPYYLLSGPSPPPPLKRDLIVDPLVSDKDRKKVLKMIFNQEPSLKAKLSIEEEKFVCNEKFIEECLDAHNLYRARHEASPLHMVHKLCRSAQRWANHLAQNGTFHFANKCNIGENLFCRNVSLNVQTKNDTPDISGEEVAAYWYSDVKDYKFNIPNSALQAYAGSFSQMVWMNTKEVGFGKALSRGGKLIVVAHYYPPGNIEGVFHKNVLPLSIRALATEMMNQIDQDAPKVLSDAKNIPNAKSVSGVLAAQPPNIIGRNATRILAARMLGHGACVVTTPEEKLEVKILPAIDKKKKKINGMKYLRKFSTSGINKENISNKNTSELRKASITLKNNSNFDTESLTKQASCYVSRKSSGTCSKENVTTCSSVSTSISGNLSGIIELETRRNSTISCEEYSAKKCELKKFVDKISYEESLSNSSISSQCCHFKNINGNDNYKYSITDYKSGIGTGYSLSPLRY